MNGNLPDVLRANQTKSALESLKSASTKRLAAAPPPAKYTTLPDGRVLDAAGHTIFTPTPRDAKKQ